MTPPSPLAPVTWVNVTPSRTVDCNTGCTLVSPWVTNMPPGRWKNVVPVKAMFQPMGALAGSSSARTVTSERQSVTVPMRRPVRGW